MFIFLSLRPAQKRKKHNTSGDDYVEIIKLDDMLTMVVIHGVVTT
jgi:hypothetical protein